MDSAPFNPAMAPKNLTLALKIRRQKKADMGRPTNLYLLPVNKTEGAKLARDRYGWSLSHMVNRLLEKERRHPGGVVNASLHAVKIHK